MKILLVLPAADHLRIGPDRPTVPRRAMLRFSILPLTTVAALTPPEHSVTLCDENVEALDFDTDADLVGVSFMTALANRAYDIARIFRAKGKTVVCGGFHPTLCPDEAMRHFDAVVAGDAEVAWPRLLSDVEAGTLKPLYKNETPCRLDETPVPRRDLTARTASHYVTTHAVQTGRGCTHGCRYCSVTAFHQRTHRHRPLDSVLAELRQLPRHFMFVDDNIIADRDYAEQLFRAMAPLKKRWVSQCDLEIADDPMLLDLARKAGCRGMFIGIETVSEKNLADVDKGFNKSRDYQQRLAAIRRRGIGVVAGMIVGLDHDDPAVFERTLRFLQKVARVDALQLNILTPLPGTPLYDDFRRKGRIIDRDWSHYDFRHCVIQPARMTRRQLQEGADWLYAQFYRLDRILWRFARSLFTLGPLPAVLSLKLNLTYRYDNRREGIVGRNPNELTTRTDGTPWRGRLIHLISRFRKPSAQSSKRHSKVIQPVP